jgi:hypothetical protein
MYFEKQHINIGKLEGTELIRRSLPPDERLGFSTTQFFLEYLFHYTPIFV